MSQYIFIYGTLRPGLAKGEIARAVKRLKPVGEGSLPGVLYDLGDYPGAIVDAAAGSRILGTVFELPQDAGVLRAMDAYEGFNPDAASDSLFVRVEHDVELADGHVLRCWIYIYNLEPVGARVLLDGRFQSKAAS